ncbi:MAG: TetR/AcrR family transcriptional regulator [Actinomycetota bacterium]
MRTATDARALRLGAPRPLLSRTAEARLGTRHREVLDAIEAIFVERGFAQFTIADLASRIGCSRRTLYELAPSKDQLVLVVLDRFLHRKGRNALDAIDPEDPVAEQIRSYLAGGVEFGWEHRFGDDLADDAAARRLVDVHYRFVMTVVQRLLDRGVERGEFRPVDTQIAAATLTGAALFISEPTVLDEFTLPHRAVVDRIVDLVVPPLVVSAVLGTSLHPN